MACVVGAMPAMVLVLTRRVMAAMLRARGAVASGMLVVRPMVTMGLMVTMVTTGRIVIMRLVLLRRALIVPLGVVGMLPVTP